MELLFISTCHITILKSIPPPKGSVQLYFRRGKYEYQRLPMDLCNSPDIFQERMSTLMGGLEYVTTYIDDLLCITNGTWEDHLDKLHEVLKRVTQAALKINAKKAFLLWQARVGISRILGDQTRYPTS